MKVSIIVDGQTITYLNDENGWRVDWGKLRDLSKHLFGELYETYYISGGIKNNLDKETKAKVEYFLKCLGDTGWKVDVDNKRKPNDKLNVDATVGWYLRECFNESDAILLFAGDGDYYSCLSFYHEAGKLVYCIGNPKSISDNIKEKATIIDVQHLKPFIVEEATKNNDKDEEQENNNVIQNG